MSNTSLAQHDAWRQLRQLTTARIALGRAGGSLPTSELLAFQWAHARARDAVHEPLDLAALAREFAALGLETISVSSAAGDRASYLKRPDLGRRLDAPSRERLLAAAPAAPCDLALIVSDGLAAQAAQGQAGPLLRELLPLLAGEGWRLAPLILARHARVALQDEIGLLLKARSALIVLGERPGLGACDSLGCYLVYAPRPGLTDADRNCVSNIRPEGLPLPLAAMTIHSLLKEMLARKQSGVHLKTAALPVCAAAGTPAPAGDTTARPSAGGPQSTAGRPDAE